MIFFSSMIILALYNMFVYFFTRVRSYLYYVLNPLFDFINIPFSERVITVNSFSKLCTIFFAASVFAESTALAALSCCGGVPENAVSETISVPCIVSKSSIFGWNFFFGSFYKRENKNIKKVLDEKKMLW